MWIKKWLYKIYLLLTVLYPFCTQAQIEVSEIQDRFEDYHQQIATEKVYLHTNRERLTLGETLYIGGYILNGKDHTPTFLSGVLYVDLVSPTEEIVKSLKLRIDSLGRTSGEIVLSDSLDAGIYALRAYTQYQMNFDQDYLFSKTIKLLPRLSSQEVVEGSPNKVPQVLLSFFPEGGDLVAGTVNYIAFKATDQYGNPLDIKGNIYDGSGKAVAPLLCEHDGMGVVQLLLKEEKYTCTYDFAGRSFSQPLPRILPSGYLMHVTKANGRWFTEVKPHNVPIEETFLMVQCRGEVLYVIGPKPDAESIRFSLKETDLPDGIIQLTFFDTQRRAVAERLIYNENPANRMNLKLTTDEVSYSKRDNVKLEFNLADASGQMPQLATLSTTVIPKVLWESPYNTILTYLYFGSDLKGHIHKPTYYINPENSDRLKHIDLLMITHGWRRFDWDMLANGGIPELNYFFEQGIRFEGTVRSYIDRSRPMIADLNLSFAEDPLFNLETTSLDNGLFWFDKLKFNDTLTAYVMTITEDDKKKSKPENNTFIEIHEREIPPVQEHYLVPFLINPEDEKLIERGKLLFDIASGYDQKTVVLDEVVKESESELNNDPFRGRQGMIYTDPDHRIMLDSFPHYYRDVFQYLYGVPGLVVTGFAPNANVRIRGLNLLIVRWILFTCLMDWKGMLHSLIILTL